MRTIVGWCLLVSTALAARIAALGIPASTTESVGWLFLAAVPVAILLAVSREPASAPIAQVLYEAEHPSGVPDLAAASGPYHAARR